MIVSIFEFQKIVAKLNPYALEDVLKRARVVINNQAVERCEHCKQIPLTPWRAGRKFCTRACKQKAYRERKEKTK